MTGDDTDRDALAHALYDGYVVGYFARHWDKLPDHDRQRFRVALKALVASDAFTARYVPRSGVSARDEAHNDQQMDTAA